MRFNIDALGFTARAALTRVLSIAFDLFAATCLTSAPNPLSLVHRVERDIAFDGNLEEAKSNLAGRKQLSPRTLPEIISADGGERSVGLWGRACPLYRPTQHEYSTDGITKSLPIIGRFLKRLAVRLHPV